MLNGRLIQEAHQVGQRVVCHTCGGMMPILEMIADMRPDAMETFTPRPWEATRTLPKPRPGSGTGCA